MKKLIIIILLLISVQSFSQDNWKRLGLFTSSIVLNAAGDGFMDEGNKEIGHLLKAASIGTTLAIPLIIDVDKDDWLEYILSYAFIRFAIFDYTYNATRGLPIGYTGNTLHYDTFMKRIPNGFEA